jgi:MoxR-like ATPase
MAEQRVEEGTLSAQGFRETAAAIEAQVGRVIVGQRALVRHTLITMLAGGNALLEGVPGLGKTMLVRTLAQAVDCRFSRIQFTPDLMPADIVGTNLIVEDEEGRRRFQFEQGPIFGNLILADEINRATPKTQSALLEGMEERQVTVDGVTHAGPVPFTVMATQNPIEYEGTFPLPEAQLDRFLLRVHLGYPSGTDEVLIMDRQQKTHPIEELQQVTESAEIVGVQRAIREIYVDPLIKQYVVGIVDATRQHESVYLGASPRGSLALYRTCQARALLDARDFVLPDDVKELAYAALGHRIIVSPSARVKTITPAEILSSCLERVPVPGARARGGYRA